VRAWLRAMLKVKPTVIGGRDELLGRQSKRTRLAPRSWNRGGGAKIQEQRPCAAGSGRAPVERTTAGITPAFRSEKSALTSRESVSIPWNDNHSREIITVLTAKIRSVPLNMNYLRLDSSVTKIVNHPDFRTHLLRSPVSTYARAYDT